MFKDIIPSIKQYKKWSKPSKLTFVGVIISFVSLVFCVVVYFVPNNGNNITEASNNTSENVDNHASTADNPDYSSFIFPYSLYSTDVLIISFNDFQDYHENEKKIERIIQQRIIDLKYKNILSEETEFQINVKCIFLDQNYNDFDSIKSIGEKCRADILIYGNLFDVVESDFRHVQIKFLILPDYRRNQIIQGKTELKKFVNWIDLIEGSLLKDIDYIVYWLIAYDQMNRGNIDSLVKITDFLSTKFEDDSFSEFKKSIARLLIFEGVSRWTKDKNAEISNSYYLKALEYDPDNYSPYFWLGVLYETGYDDIDKALEYTKKANELQPNDPLILRALSDLYYSKGDKDLAKKYATTAVELDPENAAAHVLLGKILSNQFHEYDSAKFHLKKAIDLDKNSFLGYYYYSFILFNEKNISNELFSYLSKAMEKNPKFSPAPCLMAFAYTMKNDYKKAEEYYLRAIEINPEYDEFHFWLAGLYFNQLSNPEMGKKHMLEAIRIDPQSARNHYHLAVELERHLNDSKLVELHYSKAKQIDPNFNGLHSEFKLQGLEN